MCWLNGRNVLSKSRLYPELQLAADNDDANLTLIWFHRHFQKNVNVLLPKNTCVEILQMCYRHQICL